MRLTSTSMRLTKENTERLKAFCKGWSVSQTSVVNLLLSLPFDDADILTVVLKLPRTVMEDDETLSQWLADAVDEIRSHFHSGNLPE